MIIRLAPRMAAAEAAVGFGVTLRLAPVTLPAWRAALRDGQLRIADARAGAPVTHAEASRLMTGAVADHFIVGWDGVRDEADAPVPVTPEAVAALLAVDPALHHAVALALDAHLEPALKAAAEGEASPPARNGAHAGGCDTAPTAPTPRAGGAPAAGDGAARSPAPKTSIG